MLKFDDLAQIQFLKSLGLSRNQVSERMGICHRTVTKYWETQPDQLRPSKRRRPRTLDKMTDEVRELFREHRNCARVHQILCERHQMDISIRTVQAFLHDYRRELEAEMLNAAERYAQDPRIRLAQRVRGSTLQSSKPLVLKG